MTSYVGLEIKRVTTIYSRGSQKDVEFTYVAIEEPNSRGMVRLLCTSHKYGDKDFLTENTYEHVSKFSV